MRSRWLPLVILSVSAAALLGVLVSISVGEHREEQLDISGSGDVQELIGGIHQLGERLGDEDAPITLTLFTDAQCPHCADYQLGTIDPLIEDLVRTGKASIVLKNFSLGAKEVTLGGIGVEAAADQDHGWQYLEMFMRNQDQAPTEGVNQDFLDEVAGATPGLEVTEWEAADADLAVQQRLTDDVALNVQGPSGTNVLLEDAPSRTEIDAAITRVGG